MSNVKKVQKAGAVAETIWILVKPRSLSLRCSSWATQTNTDGKILAFTDRARAMNYLDAMNYGIRRYPKQRTVKKLTSRYVLNPVAEVPRG